MTLFRPNTTCELYNKTDDLDIYGERSWNPAITTPCAVVTYDLSMMKTSVRADSSGSRGRGEHLAGVARFLFPKTVNIDLADRVMKDGFWLEVIEKHPRYSVAGQLDHWEIDFNKTEPISAT